MLTCMRYMLNPIQCGGEGAESDRTRTSSNVKNFFNIEADMPLNFGTFHGKHIQTCMSIARNVPFSLQLLHRFSAFLLYWFSLLLKNFFFLLLKKSRNPRRRPKMAAVQK